MATPITVLVAKIANLHPHSNAEKLELVEVNGWQLCVPKNTYKEGDKIVFIPPDSIIPEAWIEKWGVRSYLKGSEKNRVGKVALRGEPSFGLPVQIPEGQDWEVGTNVADFFGITKYEPPVKPSAGDAATPHPLFSCYTDIENLRNYPTVFNEGEEVVCTEKIHGGNCRVGVVQGEKMAGSMELRRAMPFCYVKKTEIAKEVIEKLGKNAIDSCPENLTGRSISSETRSLMREKEVTREDLYDKREVESLDDQSVKANPYWFPWTIPAVRNMMESLQATIQAESFVVYGEVYGGSIQSLDYGVKAGTGYGFRIFDICINGEFVSHDKMVAICNRFDVEMVPVLYRGPFSLAKVKEVSGGDTTMAGNHMREGTVVRPVKERTHPVVGRLVMKYISDQYLLANNSDSKDQ
jgi:RNA ligase (TIGR02306 family)